MEIIYDWNNRLLNGLEAYRDPDGFLYHIDLLDLTYNEDAGGYVDMQGRDFVLDDDVSDLTVYEKVKITMEGDIVEIK